MEGNTHLLQVIRKMRSQINKLERENRALRGELQVCRQSAVPPEREAAKGGGNGNVRTLADDEEGRAGPPASLRGSIVAGPAPAPKEQTGTEEPGLSVTSMCAAHDGSPSPAVTYLWGMGDEPPAGCLVNVMEALWLPSVPTPKPTLAGCFTLGSFYGVCTSPKLSLVGYFAAAQAKSSTQRIQLVLI